MSAITFVQSGNILSIIRGDRVLAARNVNSISLDENPNGSISFIATGWNIDVLLEDLESLTGETAEEKIAFFGATYIETGGSVTIAGNTPDTAAGDFASLPGILIELQGKADLSDTQPISVASLPLPSGAATQTTLASVLTDTSAIKAAVEIIDNAIAGNEMQVDVLTTPVKTGTITRLTVPSNSTAINVLGTRTVTIFITQAGVATSITLTLEVSDGVTFRALSTLVLTNNVPVTPTIEGCYHSIRIVYVNAVGGTPTVDMSLIAV